MRWEAPTSISRSSSLQDVKEKYSGLRVYIAGYPKGWSEHEYAWEYISEHTCMKCGKFPSPVIDDGWISCFCNNCYKHIYDTNIKEEYADRE